MSAIKNQKRGRPKSEQKRQAIYEAASHLFLEHGYDNVSMDRVADQAAVSKQTVYSYFANKESLFCACIEDKCDSYGLTPDTFDLNLPIRDVLLAVANKFSNMLLSDDAIRLKRLLCAHAESNPRLSSLFFEAGPKRLMTLLNEYLIQLNQRKTMDINDTQIATRQFLYMLQAEAQMRGLLNIPGGPDKSEINRYIEQCVSLFLNYYSC